MSRNTDEDFADWVRDYHHALIAVAVPLVGVSEAEEVVQNAWLKAYQAMAKFEGRSSVRTWLTRIVINESKMQLRSRKRETLMVDTSVADEPPIMSERFDERGHWSQPLVSWGESGPDQLLSRDQLVDCLERLFERMPQQQRIVLELRDSSELPFDEICNELELSASNARVLLHRARGQVLKLVDHFEETGEC